MRVLTAAARCHARPDAYIVPYFPLEEGLPTGKYVRNAWRLSPERMAAVPAG